MHAPLVPPSLLRSRPVLSAEDAAEAQVADAVFAQSYIPKKLDDVMHYERDHARLSSGKDTGEFGQAGVPEGADGLVGGGNEGRPRAVRRLRCTSPRSPGRCSSLVPLPPSLSLQRASTTRPWPA